MSDNIKAGDRVRLSLQAVRPELESNGLSAVAVGLYLAAQGCLAAAVIKEENA